MFICEECGERFAEPIEEETTYEAYYGVSDLFNNTNKLTNKRCPFCESEDYRIAMLYDDQDEDEEDE